MPKHKQEDQPIVEDKQVSRLLETGRLERLPLERLDPSGYNPNVQDKPEYDYMKADLKENGQAYPLIVAPARKGFHVILDGNHRLRAMQELGWKDALCMIVDVPNDARRMISVRLNKNRGHLDPFKLAAIFKEELEGGLNQVQIGQKYGYAQPTVANILAAAGLKGEVAPDVAAMAPKHLLAQIARIEDAGVRKQVISDILSDKEKIPSERDGSRIVALAQVADEYKPFAEAVPEDRQEAYADWLKTNAPPKKYAKRVARLLAESPGATIDQVLAGATTAEVSERGIVAEARAAAEAEVPEDLEGAEAEIPGVKVAISPPTETTCPHCGTHLLWNSQGGFWEEVTDASLEGQITTEKE